MLLKQGTSIAAQIYPPCDLQFREIITEGKVYYLEYYRVREWSRRYRPVNNSLSICFTRWTKVEQVADPTADFPLYTYSLTPYGGLRQRVDRKEEFTGILIVFWVIKA